MPKAEPSVSIVIRDLFLVILRIPDTAEARDGEERGQAYDPIDGYRYDFGAMEQKEGTIPQFVFCKLDCWSKIEKQCHHAHGCEEEGAHCGCVKRQSLRPQSAEQEASRP